MKKGFLLTVSLAVIACVFSLVAFASAPISPVVDVATSDNGVITVSDSGKTTPDANKVLEARFLNMLNRSFVYDSAFDTVEAVVNASVIALLYMRDSEDDSFISQSIVSDFVYSMYGVDNIDYSDINTQFEQREGYVYIIPRGFELYSHKIVNVNENEDGSYTVKTQVTISTHDGMKITDVCETLFVKNAVSKFGFNIIYSNIGIPAAAI